MLIDETVKKQFEQLSVEHKAILAACEFLAFDFDGVFTDNKVYINDQGEEMVRCDRSDTYGLKELKALGVEVMIISTEKNPVVQRRAEKLKLPCLNDLPDKAKALRTEASNRNIDLADTIYVGNDINDLTCFAITGFKIAVADAYPPVRNQADYVTRATGGNGAVREVIALLLLAKE